MNKLYFLMFMFYSLKYAINVVLKYLIIIGSNMHFTNISNSKKCRYFSLKQKCTKNIYRITLYRTFFCYFVQMEVNIMFHK